MSMREEAVVVLRLDATSVTTGSQQAATALTKVGAAGEISTRQTAAAMRTLPAQFTDIATQLQGGANPLTILLQQGGQIKDSFGGFGPTFRALGAALTPLRLAIGGTAAAVGAFALAAYQGHEDSDKLNKTLALLGPTSAATAGQVELLSRKLAASSRVSVSAAREITTELVATGKLAVPALEAAGQAAVAIGRLTGQSAKDIAKGFADAADAPAEFAKKANASYNFLSAAQYEQIRQLESMGLKQQAARVALEALAATMQQRAVPAMGALETVTSGVSRAFSNFWDSLKAIGRETTAEERIVSLRDKLADLERMRNGRFTGKRKGTFDAEIAAVEAEVQAFERANNRSLLNKSEAAAAQAAQNAKIEQLSTAHQAALANIANAGSAKTLAEQMRNFSAGEEALKLSFQRREVYAQDYQQALLAIDLARISAEEAAVKRQQATEAAKKPGTPEERLAQQAALVQYQTKLVQLEEKRQKILADEAAGRRDIAPNNADELPTDALRRINARDNAIIEAEQHANDARYAEVQQFLQDLRDANKRAEIEQLADEEERGRQLVELDRQIALRRLAAQQLPTGARDEATALINRRAQIDADAYGRATYDDVRGALVAAFQDSHSPARAFANFLGNAIFSRVSARMADALAEALVGRNGAGGSFGGLVDYGRSLWDAFNNPGGISTNNTGNQLPTAGGSAVGTNYVPRTMIVKVHQGEAIVPRKYNPAAGGREPGAWGGGGAPLMVSNYFSVPPGQSPAAYAAAVAGVVRQSEAKMLADAARPGRPMNNAIRAGA